MAYRSRQPNASDGSRALTVRFPKDVYARLAQLADEEERSVSSVCVRLVRRALGPSSGAIRALRAGAAVGEIEPKGGGTSGG